MWALVNKHKVYYQKEIKAIPFVFNVIVLSALLFMSREGVAQEVSPVKNPSSSLENDSSKDGQDSSVEQDALSVSQPMYTEETPVTLKEAEGKNPQEGIKDAFSKDQGDRFQSKNNNEVEFTTVK